MLIHPVSLLRAGVNAVRIVAGADPLGKDDGAKVTLKEAGQIVVIFALMLTVLIGLLGIAIDTTYAWRESLRVQRATDAAALAGVVYMPSCFDSSGGSNCATYNASSAATAAAAKNGFATTSTTTITPSKVSGNVDALAVSIKTDVPTFFSRIFGINSWAVSRSSKAVFIQPLHMGSPENYYGTFGAYKVGSNSVPLKGPGNETLNARGFWGSILTQGADILNGDAYQPKFNGSGSNPNPQDTTDYYNYAVYMPPGSHGGHIWIFDPAFCATNTNSTQGTGEWWFTGTNPVSTYYELYDTLNQPYDLSGQTYLGYSGTMFEADSYTDTAEGGVSVGSRGAAPYSCASGTITDQNDGEYYHNKWWELTGAAHGGLNVTLDGGANGATYRIHVTTDPPTGHPGQDSTSALNNYAIFASADSGPTPEVYGLAAMQMFSPLPQNQASTFYLAQLTQEAGSGKTVQIRLWDPGDTHMTADMSVLMPTVADSTKHCTGTDYSCWTAVSLAWTCQKVSSSGANCTGGSGPSIRTSVGSTSQYNGDWLNISISIPPGYAAYQGGWWMIRYTMGSASGVTATDETTWQVNIQGNPVHLI